MRLLKKIFPYKIYRVKGESMRPTLDNGVLVVARTRQALHVGDVVIDNERGMIKRIFHADSGLVHLCGDNASSSTEYITPSNADLQKLVWPKV